METFTAEEIAEIVHELGLPAQVETDANQYVVIEVKSEDFEWGILLGERGPFFTSVVLTAKTSIDEEPLTYANDWNLSHIAPIVVFDNPASEYQCVPLLELSAVILSPIQYHEFGV